MKGERDGCRHDLSDLERLELAYFDEPLLCTVCTNQADIGIRYATKLGSVKLCEECLRVIQIVADGHLERGDADD